MLADAVKATSTTAGTGALTLSDPGGCVTPNSAFPFNFRFKYAIYTGGDSAPVFRESGIAYLTSATSMTRAKVNATADGAGNLNTTNPTATDFAGATVTIICTPDAASLESMLPAVDGVSTINRVVSPANRNVNTSTLALTALRCHYAPSLLRLMPPAVNLQINVTTPGASGTVARLGVYALLENGYIGPLLATTGDIDVSTTGLKVATLTTPVTLPPGWYYLAIVSSGAPTITAWVSNAANSLGGHPLGAVSGGLGQIEYRYETLVSAVLPAAASPSTSASQVGSGNVPAVYVGY